MNHRRVRVQASFSTNGRREKRIQSAKSGNHPFHRPVRTMGFGLRGPYGLGSNWQRAGGTLIVARKPELTVVYDEYDYPATARCSSCGKAMPLRQRWITSAADNLNWFAEQFRLHVGKEHSGCGGTLESPGQSRDTEAA